MYQELSKNSSNFLIKFSGPVWGQKQKIQKIGEIESNLGKRKLEAIKKKKKMRGRRGREKRRERGNNN